MDPSQGPVNPSGHFCGLKMTAVFFFLAFASPFLPPSPSPSPSPSLCVSEIYYPGLISVIPWHQPRHLSAGDKDDFTMRMVSHSGNLSPSLPSGTSQIKGVLLCEATTVSSPLPQIAHSHGPQSIHLGTDDIFII